jgi:mRNA-degrading endonuclease RelE of RelBE toxin-antitoxin system
MLKVKYLEHFFSSASALKKRFSKIESDLFEYEKLLLDNRENPTPLGGGFFKSRVKNSNKNRGKSAGYRVITYYIKDETVYFVEIYDKSDRENISKDELIEILKKEEVI